jgi:hypothetical protein
VTGPPPEARRKASSESAKRRRPAARFQGAWRGTCRRGSRGRRGRGRGQGRPCGNAPAGAFPAVGGGEDGGQDDVGEEGFEGVVVGGVAGVSQDDVERDGFGLGRDDQGQRLREGGAEFADAADGFIGRVVDGEDDRGGGPGGGAVEAVGPVEGVVVELGAERGPGDEQGEQARGGQGEPVAGAYGLRSWRMAFSTASVFARERF